MIIDSYEAPALERLLLLGRQRHSQSTETDRLLITEASATVVFLVAAGLLAALSSSPRPLSLSAISVAMIVYSLAARVQYPVGSAWTAPTQLVFVPMLFLLPTPLVPLIVAACSVADCLPQAVRRREMTRLLARIGDSSYALGPALVLVLCNSQEFSWERWPIFLAVLTAQVAFDAGAGFGRTWFAERIPPSGQLPMLWLYVTDACLSCIGLLVTAAAIDRRGLVLLDLPLIGLQWLMAHERRQRLDYSVALNTAYRGTALVLGDVVEADDEYTAAHSRDVVDLARMTAERLGLSASDCRSVEYTALLHDVGKIRVPKTILHKTSGLDAAEQEIMRTHTIEGEELLNPVGGVLSKVGRYVRASHEHYDGGGYPDGLAGERIPLESRIVAVCDAYSAMTTDRPYRPAMPVAEALNELHRCAGTQFDPQVVRALDRVLTDTRPEPDLRPSSRLPIGVRAEPATARAGSSSS